MKDDKIVCPYCGIRIPTNHKSTKQVCPECGKEFEYTKAVKK